MRTYLVKRTGLLNTILGQFIGFILNSSLNPKHLEICSVIDLGWILDGPGPLSRLGPGWARNLLYQMGSFSPMPSTLSLVHINFYAKSFQKNIFKFHFFVGKGMLSLYIA